MQSHMSTLLIVIHHRHASEANAIPNVKVSSQVSFVEKAIPECIAMDPFHNRIFFYVWTFITLYFLLSPLHQMTKKLVYANVRVFLMQRL